MLAFFYYLCSMKILHTSDWHLGHQLYGYDRTYEQAAMLMQIARIAEEESPDVFILAGDIFHVAQPSASIQRMFVDAIDYIRGRCPEMKFIIIAGNHDSGTRHEIFSPVWRNMGVEAIGTVHYENPEEHILEIGGKGYVVALPYANERYVREGFVQQLLDMVNNRNKGNLPVAMTAHTTLSGIDYSGHDLRGDSIIGGIESIDLMKMGEGYDYLALGHIHHGQYVRRGKGTARYSGSPLPVSFDEDYPHTISIVELDGHEMAPKVRNILIENPRPLITLPATGRTNWDSAIKLLRQFPDDSDVYIRLNVAQSDTLPPDANDEALQAVKEKKCRFCLINYKREDGNKNIRKTLTVNEFKEESPIDIAGRYMESIGEKFDSEMKEMFQEVVRLLSEEE